MAKTRCPHCRAAMNIPDEVVDGGNKKIRCPKCREVFKPQPASQPAGSDQTAPSARQGGQYVASHRAPSSRRHPHPRKKPASPALIVGSIVLCVAVVAGLAVVVYLHGNPPGLKDKAQAKMDSAQPGANQPESPGVTYTRRRPETHRERETHRSRPAGIQGPTLQKDENLKVEAIKLHTNIYGDNLGHISAVLRNLYPETITKAKVRFFFFNEAGEYQVTSGLTVEYIPPHGTVRISQKYSGIPKEMIARIDYEIMESARNREIGCFRPAETALSFNREDKKVTGWLENVTRDTLLNPAMIVDFIGDNGKILETLVVKDLGPSFPKLLEPGGRHFVDAKADPMRFVVPEEITYRIFEQP